MKHSPLVVVLRAVVAILLVVLYAGVGFACGLYIGTQITSPGEVGDYLNGSSQQKALSLVGLGIGLGGGTWVACWFLRRYSFRFFEDRSRELARTRDTVDES